MSSEELNYTVTQLVENAKSNIKQQFNIKYSNDFENFAILKKCLEATQAEINQIQEDLYDYWNLTKQLDIKDIEKAWSLKSMLDTSYEVLDNSIQLCAVIEEAMLSIYGRKDEI